MSNIAPALPPLDITRAPEGGAVGPVQSGWRLAVREFAHNRLAVIGLAILVFFVLCCFAGPLFYHGNVLNSDLSSSNVSPGGGHPLGTTDQGFDELGLLRRADRGRAAHPYTAGLIAAIPEPDPVLAGERRARIGGALPSAITPPSGCRFRTRCPFAQEVCATEEPQLRPFGPGHVAACHFPLEAIAPATAAASSPASTR